MRLPAKSGFGLDLHGGGIVGSHGHRFGHLD
jgi:hypothetical protein